MNMNNVTRNLKFIWAHTFNCSFQVASSWIICTDCWSDKIDKLVIWEENITKIQNKSMNQNTAEATTPSMKTLKELPASACLCNNISQVINRPFSVISSMESINLALIVDATYAAASYFKRDASLFEAKYEFVHEPICGPPVFESLDEGELCFPNYELLEMMELPHTIHCVWDVRVNNNRDISLHFDKISFVSKECQEGRLELHLPSTLNNPFIFVCGHNVSALKTQIIEYKDLIPISHNKRSYIQIHFIGLTAPMKAMLKIIWTELYHLPRNKSIFK